VGPVPGADIVRSGSDFDHGGAMDTSDERAPQPGFTTTYRRGVVTVWHRCGKSIDVPGGRVTDDLYDTHACGPVGSSWGDRA
jgi:hypothetical protein